MRASGMALGTFTTRAGLTANRDTVNVLVRIVKRERTTGSV